MLLHGASSLLKGHRRRADECSQSDGHLTVSTVSVPFCPEVRSQPLSQCVELRQEVTAMSSSFFQSAREQMRRCAACTLLYAVYIIELCTASHFTLHGPTEPYPLPAAALENLNSL